MQRRDILKAGAAAATLGFPAIIRAQQKEVVILGLWDQTGAFADVGPLNDRGMRMALEERDMKILGRPVKYVTRDPDMSQTEFNVGGGLWGALAASTREPAGLPEDTERRLRDFAELVAQALANADAHEQLHRPECEMKGARERAELLRRQMKFGLQRCRQHGPDGAEGLAHRERRHQGQQHDP